MLLKGINYLKSINPYEEKIKMNFRKIKRNFRHSTRAISPVIATLLMIAIAVVASLVAYAWVMGYMGFTTAKTGKAIQIQSVSYNPTGDVFTIYVQNVGDSDVQFPTTTPNNVFINGAVATSITGAPATLVKGSTATISGAMTTLAVGVQTVTIKVTTVDGTFSQVSQQFTIS
jgi:archaeal type IV pilus assembly protein PilA